MDPIRFEALQQWRDARQQLDKALQQFHKATKDLDMALSGYAIDPKLSEEATTEAAQDLCSITLRIENLMATQVVLNKIRNGSIALVAINKLPLEILLRILRFSVLEHLSQPHVFYLYPDIQRKMCKTLFNITHVCTRWRLAVVMTTSFWSDIYLKYDDPTSFVKTCNRARVTLERAHEQPLEINFYGGNINSRSDISKITTRLRPHLKWLEVLRLLGFRNHNALLDLISFWLTHGKPGSVHSLLIWSVRSLTSIRPINITFPQQHINSFLIPIRKLCLNGVYFDWDSLAYQNLVVLQLSDLKGQLSPTLPEILTILSSCPELHTLQLQKMHLAPSEPALLQPVVLPELKYIDFLGLAAESLDALLPMIVAPSQELSAKIDLHPSASSTNSSVRLLLTRSQVTRLYISDPANADGIAEYLSAVPNLTTLILDFNSRPGDAILTAITQSSESTTQRTSRCPKLHTMYLINGSLQNETVQDIVGVHSSLKKLRFMSCFLEPFDEELLYWLKPFVKDVECRTKLGATAGQWYRRMT